MTSNLMVSLEEASDQNTGERGHTENVTWKELYTRAEKHQVDIYDVIPDTKRLVW